MSASSSKPWFRSWPTGVRQRIDIPTVTVHQRFSEVVAEHPTQPFLTLLGMRYSYQDIADWAGRFASYLIDLGVEKGDRVGLLMPNIPQFVGALFGTFQVGAVAVPINPLYGTEDLKFQINDSGVRVIVILDILYGTLEDVRDACPLLEHVVVASIGELLSPTKRFLAKMVGKLPKAPATRSQDKPFLKTLLSYDPFKGTVDLVPDDDLALLQYTGGTTGRPKGAMISHMNLISNMYQAREWAINVPEPFDFMGAVPFFHLVGLTTVLLATVQFEGTVHLVPNPRDFDMLLKTISDNRATLFHGVPTLFRALVNHPKLDKYDLTSLKICFSGSAPLAAGLAKKFVQATKADCLMVEAFGMTELSPMASAFPMEPDKIRYESIGVPIVNTEMKIVDLDTGEDLLPGEVGEIAVRGPQVMKGYWQQPEETAAVIRDGFMHTGDIGFMSEDGYFHLINRKKDIINASGFKVFPREVEDHLLNHASIEEVAVCAAPDEYRGETVKAIVVPKKGVDLTEEEVIQYCRGKIAKFKVPRKVEIRSELPKTSIGKVDRKALRAIEFGEEPSHT